MLPSSRRSAKPARYLMMPVLLVLLLPSCAGAQALQAERNRAAADTALDRAAADRRAARRDEAYGYRGQAIYDREAARVAGDRAGHDVVAADRDQYVSDRDRLLAR